jgi:hypothetical protein
MLCNTKNTWENDKMTEETVSFKSDIQKESYNGAMVAVARAYIAQYILCCFWY